MFKVIWEPGADGSGTLQAQSDAVLMNHIEATQRELARAQKGLDANANDWVAASSVALYQRTLTAAYAELDRRTA